MLILILYGCHRFVKLDPQPLAFSSQMRHSLPCQHREAFLQLQSLTFDLACNLLMLKQFTIKAESDWKAIASGGMPENIRLSSVGISTQPYLTPFVTGYSSVYYPSFLTHGIMHAWNSVEMGWTARLCLYFSKPILTHCVECFGEADKGNVKVHILFMSLLLAMPWYKK